MTDVQIQEYLLKYRINSAEGLLTHINELKRNSNPNLTLISELAYHLADSHSFPAQKIISIGSSTRHKSKNGETHLEKESLRETNSRIGSKNLILDDLSQKEIERNFGITTVFIGSSEEDKYKNGIIVNSSKENRLDLAKKETEGKLYYELSWEFIEEMAKRMSNNKSNKYPLYNWKKNINVEDLKQAINRHHIEVMKGNYKDGDEVLGHIISYACNSMMLWEQLNKNNNADLLQKLNKS